MVGVSLRKEGFTNCAKPLLSALKRRADSGEADWKENRFAVKITHKPNGNFRAFLAALESAGAQMVGLPKDDHTIVVATGNAIAQLGKCKDIRELGLVRTTQKWLISKMPEGTIVNFQQPVPARSLNEDTESAPRMSRRPAPAGVGLNVPAA